MSNLMIEGGRRLSGSLPVYGAKNAILPILAACIMTEEEVVLESCPVLSADGRIVQCDLSAFGMRAVALDLSMLLIHRDIQRAQAL